MSDHAATRSTRVLLSSPTQPFGPRAGDAFSCRTNAAFQLTWAQDGFRFEDAMQHWGLDLIAANIEAPTTVMHYPSLARFKSEVRKQYDWVGLTFNLCTFHKIKPMVEAVRRLAPDSRVILGGYGAVLDDETLKPWADEICREEGITFMRRLLGEEARSFTHPHISIDRRIFSLSTGERTGIVFPSVGCPHGCDFCITSHFFNRRPVRFLETGGEVFDVMQAMRNRDPGISSFAIMDEDFLGDRGRALGLLDCVRNTSAFFDMMVFSSLHSVSQYDPADIAEMGITRLWIGYEARDADYAKLKGPPFADVVSSLRRYGISVVVSMIVGYDYQTPDIVRDELREVMSVRPTATQIMVFSPCPGTPALDRLREEGRLDPEVRTDYRLHDGYSLLYHHPKMSRSRVEGLVRELYAEEYRTLGPSPFRYLETALLGCRNPENETRAVLRQRQASFRRRLRRGAVLFPLGRWFGPNNGTGTAELRRSVADAVGGIGARRALGHALVPFFLWSRLRYRHGWFEQPRFCRRVYE